MKPRFTILGLMGVVAVAAFVLASWQMATEFWASVAFNLTALTLIVASCKAKFSKGPAGAWWFGFALFGWAHLVLGLLGMARGPLQDVALMVPLPLIFLETVIIYRWPGILGGDGASHETLISRMSFLLDLLCLLVGYVGAWIVWFFADRSRPDEHGRQETKA